MQKFLVIFAGIRVIFGNGQITVSAGGRAPLPILTDSVKPVRVGLSRILCFREGFARFVHHVLGSSDFWFYRPELIFIE